MAKTVKILQWNVWFEEDIKNVLSLLKQVDADIVCLQELTKDSPTHNNGIDTVGFIGEGLGFNVHSQDMDVGKYGLQSNAILSRYPLRDQTSHWINEPINDGGYDDEYRCYVEAVADVDGVDLRVGTTHMSYTHKFADTERKLTEGQRLRGLINHDSNFVLAGDFNARPDSLIIRDLQQRLKSIDPYHDLPTWTTKSFELDGFKAGTLEWRLDYIFGSKDIKVVASEIITTDYSDHLPILTEIQLQ